MSFRDAGAAGGVGGIFAIGADLLVNGGEVVFALLGFLLDQGGIVYLLLSRLLAAAPRVAWLPTAKIETAFTVVSLVLAAVALFQLARRARSGISERL